MKYRRFLCMRAAALILPVALTACGSIGHVERVEIAPNVRGFVYADDPNAEPFAFEIFDISEQRWYDAVQVTEGRYVLSNRGKRRLWQDQIRGADWNPN